MPAEKLGLKEIVAMGIGGMVGGGIFSVLGLAMNEGGHAAPIAFMLGGLVALITGYSYTRLGLAFHSDGGSFTYLERAFGHPNIAGLGGWILLVGYVGTLSLYAYTFGAYGTALFGDSSQNVAMHHLLASLILLVFLAVNLYGVQAAGKSEDVIVMIKVLILTLFAIVGIAYVQSDHLLPVLNKGKMGMLMAAALIFVAYEGFELIPNAMHEMESPDRDLARGIFLSIGITTAIYVLVSFVAVGNLLPDEIAKYKEYALAIAAKPFLGKSGFVMIGLAALLSTASAINATLFGTARLGMVMASEKALPVVFSLKERRQDIPWASLLMITGLSLLFVNAANLTIISSFASATFLLIFASIHLSAWRLRHQIGIRSWVPVVGMAMTMASWLILMGFLWRTDKPSLMWMGAFFLLVILAEVLYSERRWVFREAQCFPWKGRRGECHEQLLPTNISEK